ncbi:TPA: hypothetical protein H1012_04090 [archaeon]|nr:hypothetical protein [Candidatus Naiadarchaeales archaeon SRR2090153.bin461]HIK02995.1 hypothetical protein [Candidatus Naiadarchaeales archaeon SRR2090159.bin1288]
MSAEIERDIIDTFAEVSQSLGYSEAHGKILAALLLSGKEVCQDDLAKKTRYSPGMISLSIDLLEVIGLVKRVKKPNDRKLYVRFEGDLLEAMKTAILIKLKKGLTDVSGTFEGYEKKLQGMKNPEAKELLEKLHRLDKEAKRIERYVGELSKVESPK